MNNEQILREALKRLIEFCELHDRRFHENIVLGNCRRALAFTATSDSDSTDAARYGWLKAWNKTDGFNDRAIDREIAIDAAIAATKKESP